MSKPTATTRRIIWLGGLIVLLVFLLISVIPSWRLAHVVDNGELNIPLLRKVLASEFAHGRDPQEIYELVKKTTAGNNIGVQHQAAHVFGEVLFDYMGSSGVRVCDNELSFGCFHSLFGRAIAAGGVSIVSTLEAGCIEAYGLGGLGCVHGIGHGLGEYFGPQRIREQLEMCKTLSWKGTLFGCSDGVFMEYHFPSDVQATRITTGVMPVATGEEYDPCLKVGNLYQSSCYFSLPSWWVDALKQDEVRMDGLCQGVADAELQRYCFLGVGYAMAPVLRYDTQEVQRRCDHMTGDDNQLLCRAGAAFAFFVNEQERPRAAGMCEGLGDEVLECVQTSQLLRMQEP